MARAVFIEKRHCSVSIRFYNAGEDACWGEPGGFYSWDPVNSVLMSNFESFYHLHQVTGVYIREVWVQNGIGGGANNRFHKAHYHYRSLNH